MKMSILRFIPFIKNTVSYSLPQGFTVTAHTGCEGMPDNSLDSIKAGAAAGADIVEIDLHFLPDGTPVLKHDTPSAAEADKLPSLDSAFELLASMDIRMNVDVKATANLSAVAMLAEKHGVTDRIFFTGVNENFVDAAKNDASCIPYYLNVNVKKSKNTDPAYLNSLVEKVRSCGAVGINMNYKACSTELVSTFRKANLPVSLWTANSKRTMHKCLCFAPDNITTRKPSELISIIDR